MTREGSVARGSNMGTLGRDTQADRGSNMGTLVRGTQVDRISVRDGARSKTPPGTPRRGSKLLSVRVQLLDDSVTVFQVQVRYCQFYIFLDIYLPPPTLYPPLLSSATISASNGC